MSTLVVVGAQWGDEGKGKVVDALAKSAQVVARYAGGNNAGHTLVVGGKKIVTHLVPSGCAYAGTLCVLGAGMVVDLDVFRDEVEALQRDGMLQAGELRVSLDAHLIFPYHRVLDGAREDKAKGGASEIGTTRRGIGPAYEAKAGRRGIRVRDLFHPERLRIRLEQNAASLNPELTRLQAPSIDIAEQMARADAWASWIKPMVCDTGELVFGAIEAGQRVLIEGAQGALLDLDHGTYPYVTSSNTIAGGACTGLGVGPTVIDAVWGITKAYTTRVGAGPFPTRLDGEMGEKIRQAGAEFGATTGRPRDCGWLDLPALRYAVRRNGLTGLCVSKLDVLAHLPRVEVCTGYVDGCVPGVHDFSECRPVYRALEGWGDPSLPKQIGAARKLVELPAAARAYLDMISEFTGVEITLVSVGPDRQQTIPIRDAF